jgi:hypothetical protein
MSGHRVLLFDRSGGILAEIEPDLESVAWRLNNVGRARFAMAWDDPKCTRDNLRFGNRALIQFDNGLPDWGGVIDTPRKRRHGLITVTAYTGERLLDWRVTARSRYFTAALPGTIFETLIGEENDEWQTGVTVGSAYGAGTPRTIEVHYHDLLQRIRDLARLTGHDFAVLPVYADGTLSFQAHWYERRGSDKRESVWLLDGANASGARLDEQGTLANRVITIGDGTSWTERPIGEAEDTASRDEYGYREYAEVQAGVVEQATADANAEEVVATMAWPLNRVTLSAANKAPGEFARYDVGDIVKAVLFVDNPEWYFESPVRVIGREWRPDETCRLEVEEWFRS